jgi:hypothetical protein
MSAQAENARDVESWAAVIQLEQSDIVSRMALSNLIAFALKKSLEVEALKAALDGRPSCAVLRLVK